MPGPHLELKLMQCYEDTGGADAWLTGHWDRVSQWWTGWHLPGPAGRAGLSFWSWPNPDWVLIGFERWDYFSKFPHSRLMEALYQHPNPSTLAWEAGELIPEGHWHIVYNRQGHLQTRTWDPNPLVEPQNLYLKGHATGKGKGKGPGDEGKGKGPGVKGKGKGKKGKQGKGKNELGTDTP